MERKNKFLKVLTACLLTALLLLTFVPAALAADSDPVILRSDNGPLYYGLMAALPGKLDLDSDGTITAGELSALSANDIIYIDGSSDNNHNGNLTDDKVTSLDGLDNAINITTIRLPNNSLTPGTLPFLDDLTNLKELDLSDNTTITDISALTGYSSLQSLHLKGTGITSLPTDMTGMTSLYQLTLGGHTPLNTDDDLGTPMNINNLAELYDIPKFQTLDTDYPGSLTIDNCNITDISMLNSCAGITQILWRYNEGANTPANFGSLPNLYYLDLREDRGIDNSMVDDIAGLTCFNTYVAGKPTATLCISGTGITDVSALSAAYNLAALYWQDIPALTPTNAESLKALKNLSYLTNIDLSNDTGLGNGILPIIKAKDSSGHFYLPSLRTLGIGNCGITNLIDLTGRNDLTSIALGGNKITRIDALRNMINLVSVTMNNNYVADLSPLIGKPINYLDCSRNYLDISDGSADRQVIADLPAGQPDDPLDPYDYHYVNYSNAFQITIHYDPTVNGSTPSKTTEIVYYGQSFKLPVVTSTDPGLYFHGWDANAKDGTSSLEVVGQTTSVSLPRPIYPYETIPSNDITYTAVFSPTKYTVTFDPQNGGSTSSVITGYNTTVSAPAVSRTGYSISGWYKEATSATPWNFSSDKVTGNIILYAGWTPNNYSVSFDAQGGAVSPGSKGVTYNAPYGTLPVPTKTGFSFAGWRTSGGAVVTEESAVTTAADHTLYAAWQFMGPYLSGIQNTCGTWNKAFVKTTYSYKITLGENDPALTLTPIKEYDGATVTANKTLSGISPANGKSVTVKITVKYGSLKKTYTITVTRAKSTNNNLSSLTAVGGTFDSPFDPAVTSYILNVGENTKSVTLKAAAAAGKLAGVSPATKKITLNNGDTKIVKITVKAQSGAKKVYTITVVRAPSTDANLKSLKASGGTLTPVFSAGNTNYSITLPANKSVVTLTAKPNGYKSAVYINDVKRTSLKVTLAASGEVRTVHIRVTAQSGDVKDYYITVQKP